MGLESTKVVCEPKYLVVAFVHPLFGSCSTMPIETCDLWLWFQGCRIDSDQVILGLSATWWGRIAKVLQFLSGSVILFEIIGFNRIRKGGKLLAKKARLYSLLSLHPLVQPALKIKCAELRLYWLDDPSSQPATAPNVHASTARISSPTEHNSRNRLRAQRRLIEAEIKRAKEKRESEPRLVRFMLSAAGFGAFLIYVFILIDLVGNVENPFINILIYVGLFFSPAVFPLTSMLVLVVISVTLRLPFWTLELLVLRPIGTFLEQPMIREVILTISYILLLLGFLIDLALS